MKEEDDAHNDHQYEYCDDVKMKKKNFIIKYNNDNYTIFHGRLH